ncbi:hypothetical protein O9G_000506 [Rozella allomycis CSF55]|uniref:Uncharacterized protein n=1 Tax=Rozella allomycis (strain CSF55) TaxID=988480 RepID=A0A075B0J2_ROZAC|nr:hypothetical protein O9G_000506 [Rozella allomycis CSF55]|eukprot:EPZ34319.1 hypothetical protein O9G_000506 [Rozella allomycis CSF55]
MYQKLSKNYTLYYLILVGNDNLEFHADLEEVEKKIVVRSTQLPSYCHNTLQQTIVPANLTKFFALFADRSRKFVRRNVGHEISGNRNGSII